MSMLLTLQGDRHGTLLIAKLARKQTNKKLCQKNNL
jgi:hypothetical protein